MNLVDRFLSYVKVDTQSDENNSTKEVMSDEDSDY